MQEPPGLLKLQYVMLVTAAVKSNPEAQAIENVESFLLTKFRTGLETAKRQSSCKGGSRPDDGDP